VLDTQRRPLRRGARDRPWWGAGRNVLRPEAGRCHAPRPTSSTC